MQDVFIDYVKNEKARGKTILLSSHIFSEVDATCDRIAIIKDGRIVSDFIADDLRHASRKNYLIGFSSKEDYERFVSESADATSFSLIGKNENELSALISTDDKNINGVIETLSAYHIVSFRHLKETLEDYFMSYYKEDKDFGGTFKK